jgi:hypothetical protein
MTHARRTRVRWGNVGRAALAVPVVALVVAWPRLDQDPPALPDDRPVPVAGATAGAAEAAGDVPPTLQPVGPADGASPTPTDQARPSERRTGADAAARAARSGDHAERTKARTTADAERTRARPPSRARRSSRRRRSTRAPRPARTHVVRTAQPAAGTEAPVPDPAPAVTPPRPVVAPPTPAAPPARTTSAPPEFGFEQ